MTNPYFKDGCLNREPRKPSPVTDFKHGKGFGYNPKVAKSPLQKVEMKK